MDAVALEADSADAGTDERTDAAHGGQAVGQIEGGAGGLGVDEGDVATDVLTTDVQAEVELIVEVGADAEADEADAVVVIQFGVTDVDVQGVSLGGGGGGEEGEGAEGFQGETLG